MKIKKYILILLALIVLFNPCIALIKVPGDLNSDLKVSDDELKQAELLYQKGEHSSQNLSEIKHIHELYPRAVIDSKGRTVTIYKPIKTIVCTLSHYLETLRTLKVPSSYIIGAPQDIDIYSIFPEYKNLPTVGHFYEPDVEKIIKLNPDIVLIHPGSGTGTFGAYFEPLIKKLDAAGLTVGVFACSRPEIYTEELQKLGVLFEKENESKKFLDFYNGVLDPIKNATKDLPPDKKPLVYSENSPYKASENDINPIEAAGGRSIFAGKGEIGEVNPEDVVSSNPDVIIRILGDDDYDRKAASDTSNLKKVRDEIMSRPELKNTTAVRNGKVYLIASPLWTYMPFSGCRHFIGVAYLAKWLHPDLFRSLDPKAIHQQYLTEFQGLDYDLNKRGTLVYPET